MPERAYSLESSMGCERAKPFESAIRGERAIISERNQATGAVRPRRAELQLRWSPRTPYRAGGSGQARTGPSTVGRVNNA